jgi:hypothetical protein
MYIWWLERKYLSMATSEIELVTFWQVAQCPNQLRHRLHTFNVYPVQNTALHSISSMRMRMRPSFRNVRNTFRDVAATYIPLCKSIQTSRTLAEIGSRHRSTIALTGFSFNIYISSPEAVAPRTTSKPLGILLIPVTHTQNLEKYFKKRQYDRVPIVQLKKIHFLAKKSSLLLKTCYFDICGCFSTFFQSISRSPSARAYMCYHLSNVYDVDNI